jgi:CelD/BcsL family acetyltransferase involved in cellulose biosynthesis
MIMQTTAAPSDAGGSGQAVPGSWEVRTVPLKFKLGEMTLFKLPLSMAVGTAHFSEMQMDAFCDWAHWDSVPHSVQGVAIKSQPVSAELPKLTRLRGAIRYVPAQYRRFYVEFGQSFEEYLQKFSSQSRSKRRREMRRFAESSGGTLDLRTYRTPEELAEFLRVARELSQKTFQERLLDAGLPAGEPFRQQLLVKGAAGKIRGFILFHAGQAAAYLLYEIRDPGIVISQYTGYDPQLRALSPGTVVHHLSIERLFAESGLHMLDFTEGEGTHKQYFATASRLCADIYILKPSLRVRAILRLHATIDSLSRRTVRLLDRLGLKAQIKKLIRARA